MVVIEKGCQSIKGTHDARHLCGPHISPQAVRPAALHCHGALGDFVTCTATLTSQQPSVEAASYLCQLLCMGTATQGVKTEDPRTKA